MLFKKMKLDGSYIIDIEKIEDDRGFFARAWDEEIFQELNLNSKIVQCNISFNKIKGTIRGFHYQNLPYEEARLVRCTKGNVCEIMVDIRKDSDSFLKWEKVELSAENHRMLYVPEGFALGFQTLENETELFYQMFQRYVPEHICGVLWNDPKLGIDWPLEPTIISERDKSWKLL